MEDKNSNALGIISIVTGMVGFFVFGFILGTISAITGFIGWKKSDLAKAGAIIGVIDIVALLFLLSIM